MFTTICLSTHKTQATSNVEIKNSKHESLSNNGYLGHVLFIKWLTMNWNEPYDAI